MLEWIIAADDFTGALDTSVQFAKQGFEVTASVDAAFDFGRLAPWTEILVVDTATRHLPRDAAYMTVNALIRRALAHGVRGIYKKTDSALRGNIGAEIEAAADAADGRAIFFAPAFPEMSRITRDAIHYINGVPVAESLFGSDPFEPVRSSRISEIVGRQSRLPVISLNADGLPLNPTKGVVYALDAETDGDLTAVADYIMRTPTPRLAAGCAGLANRLAAHRNGSGPPSKNIRADRIFTVCGSVNPAALAQVRYAEAAGFRVINLTPEQKLTDYGDPRNLNELRRGILAAIGKERCVLITAALSADDIAKTDRLAAERGSSGDALRRLISMSFGTIGSILLRECPDTVLFFTGGDTLRAFMESSGISEIKPVLELLPGTVLSYLKHGSGTARIVSKSGGFGAPDALVKISEMLLLG